jgi:SAM-dependent methyltransferase
MAGDPYAALAGVYEWLMRDDMLTPEGSAAAHAEAIARLAPGARVLDCAAGTGELAVGLALRGFDVVASDASAAMIARTRALADRHGARVRAVTCAWEELDRQRWGEAYDAVFCVGNSLTHAPGRDARRAALAQMRGVLREGGLLVVTSRNWERVRAAGSGIRVPDRLAQRDGRRGLVVYSWTIPARWEEPHELDIAVAILGDGGAVTPRTQRLTFSVFTGEALDADLRASGLTPVSSTYDPDADFYAVTARRPPPRSP